MARMSAASVTKLPQPRADGEDEDDAEIRPRGFERSAVMQMEVFAQRLGRAAKLPMHIVLA